MAKAKAQLPKLLIPMPHWAEKGLCRNMDPEIFFIDADADADFPNPVALAACDRCPIQAACLNWAMETNERNGVWGGTTPRQREKLRRPIVRVRCPGCSSNAILEEPNVEVCLSCGLSWRI